MDPIAKKLIEQMTPAKESNSAPGAKGDMDSRFKELLERQMKESDETTKMVQEMFGLKNEGLPKMRVTPAEPMSIEVGSEALRDKKTSAVHILNEVNRSALQMDEMIEMATSGQSFTPQEMLAMQAGVLQIGVEVEFTGQIVSSADRARNSLLNQQI